MMTAASRYAVVSSWNVTANDAVLVSNFSSADAPRTSGSRHAASSSRPAIMVQPAVELHIRAIIVEVGCKPDAPIASSYPSENGREVTRRPPGPVLSRQDAHMTRRIRWILAAATALAAS